MVLGNTTNIACLGSTRGSDLDAVISAIKTGQIKAKICIVISNKQDAYILEKAKSQGINAVFLDAKGKSREEYDKQIISLLEKNKIELVLLIGYMKILSEMFVSKYKNKIINVHPSLLPAFAGGMDKNVHQSVLDYGAKITGCTVHFVTDETDAGPIILEKAVLVEENDTAETLKEKVQKAEQEILPKAVELFVNGKLKIEGRKVRILK